MEKVIYMYDESETRKKGTCRMRCNVMECGTSKALKEKKVLEEKWEGRPALSHQRWNCNRIPPSYRELKMEEYEKK